MCWITACKIRPVLLMQGTISSESPACVTEGWQPQCREKKCVSIYPEEKTLWSWPICAKGTQRLEIEPCNKVLLTDESKFKILGSNRSLMGSEEWVEELQPPNVKHRGGSVRGGDFANCTRWRANWIRPAITAYCGATRGIMVIVAGYGHGDTSSNPGPDWLHFT